MDLPHPLNRKRRLHAQVDLEHMPASSRFGWFRSAARATTQTVVSRARSVRSRAASERSRLGRPPATEAAWAATLRVAVVGSATSPNSRCRSCGHHPSSMGSGDGRRMGGCRSPSATWGRPGSTDDCAPSTSTPLARMSGHSRLLGHEGAVRRGPGRTANKAMIAPQGRCGPSCAAPARRSPCWLRTTRGSRPTRRGCEH